MPQVVDSETRFQSAQITQWSKLWQSGLPSPQQGSHSPVGRRFQGAVGKVASNNGTVANRRFVAPGDLIGEVQIAITELGGSRTGFVVDHVIGQHQTVIKSLGRAYKDLKGIAGATILGDGNVALILDVNQLFQLSFKKEFQTTIN